jgi:hypothetical protein
MSVEKGRAGERRGEIASRLAAMLVELEGFEADLVVTPCSPGSSPEDRPRLAGYGAFACCRPVVRSAHQVPPSLGGLPH